jgi:tetratricopeptide (TPR) repeat protein
MFIEREKIDHNIKLDRQKLNGENLQSNGEYLVSFFMLGLLNIAHDLHVHKDLYNLQSEYSMIDEFIKNFNIENFIKILDESTFKYKYVIKIYYLMFLADLNIESDEYYSKFKKNLLDNIHLFNANEKYELYLKLESIAIQKIERGKKEFYNDLFEIYKVLIKDKIYKETPNTFMKLEMFRNIFFTGMTLGKIEWSEKFITDNINELSPEFRKSMLNQSMAYIYFAKKDFIKSLEYITKANFDLFVHKADVKIMMLKIYYELDMFDTAFSAVETFLKFIHKNKNLSELFKNRYVEFIKIYKTLISKKSDESSIDSTDIEHEAINSKLAVSKGWLIEKAKEF